MSYFAEPNHIEYDAWFDENIDPLDLVNYSDEKQFSNSVHFKFHKMSTRNLTIGLILIVGKVFQRSNGFFLGLWRFTEV